MSDRLTKDMRDIEDVKFVVSEVERIAGMSISEHRTHIEENRNAHDFLYFLRDPVTKGEYVCGREASWRLYKLGERHLDCQEQLRDNIDPVQFKTELDSLVAIRFLKEARYVNKREVQTMLAAAIRRVGLT